MEGLLLEGQKQPNLRLQGGEPRPLRARFPHLARHRVDHARDVVRLVLRVQEAVLLLSVDLLAVVARCATS